jgi:hypothetical protein
VQQWRSLLNKNESFELVNTTRGLIEGVKKVNYLYLSNLGSWGLVGAAYFCLTAAGGQKLVPLILPEGNNLVGDRNYCYRRRRNR